MKSKIKTSFIFPTLNEIKNIQFLLDKLKNLKFKNDIEFLFIDDNSVDGTFELIEKYGKLDKRIKIIKRIKEKGLSSAIKAGCLISKGDYMAVMDSDGQHDIETLLFLIKELDDKEFLDIVIASRFLKDSIIETFPNKRKLISRIGNYLAKISLHNNYFNLSDYLSGCFVLKRKNCKEFISKIDSDGFKFLYELLFESKGKLNIQEKPFVFHVRRHGKSKLNLYIMWIYLSSVLKKLLMILRNIIIQKV